MGEIRTVLVFAAPGQRHAGIISQVPLQYGSVPAVRKLYSGRSGQGLIALLGGIPFFHLAFVIYMGIRSPQHTPRRQGKAGLLTFYHPVPLPRQAVAEGDAVVEYPYLQGKFLALCIYGDDSGNAGLRRLFHPAVYGALVCADLSRNLSQLLHGIRRSVSHAVHCNP